MDIEHIVEKVTKQVLDLIQKSSNKYFILGQTSDDLQKFLSDNAIMVNQSFEEAKNSSGALILTVSSIKSFIRLSHLIATNSLEDFIVDTLVEQRKLFIEERFECPKNQHILKIINQARADLTKLGVVFLNASNYGQHLLEKPALKETNFGLSGAVVKKTPVTLDVISHYDFTASKTFHLEPNMILTALAKDYLREHDIKIVKEQ